MSALYKVHGADELERTMRAAGEQLADLSEVNRRAGDLVLSRARSRTPVRTGRLVGSLTATATPGRVEMGSPLVYAGPVHNGWPAHHIEANPFLADAVRASEDQVVGLYADEVLDAISGVKGA